MKSLQVAAHPVELTIGYPCRYGQAAVTIINSPAGAGRTKNEQMKKYLLMLLYCAATMVSYANSNLSRIISVSANREKLTQVLEKISHAGNFYFSYNSALIKKDSLVTIQASHKPVRFILDRIFSNRLDYREAGNYIILRPKPIEVKIITKPVAAEEKFFSLNGFVVNGITGERLPEVSIYEKFQLISTLTNEQGTFSISLKARYPTANLSISKKMYRDTTIAVNPSMKQEISVSLYPDEIQNVIITPEDVSIADSIKELRYADAATQQEIPGDSNKIEQKFLGTWFVSQAQKIQSLNLGDWFVSRPFQLSVTPGLSTHGKMSGQVVNNFSLNIFGGYTGGLKGMEVAGLFSINRGDAIGFQAGGLFNHTGGKQAGFQAAGIGNTTLESMTGFQAGGVVNYNRTQMTGFQAAGVLNFNGDAFKGFQAAGVYNHAGHNVAGMQVSGVANFATNRLNGVQVGGVFNYAKHNKGLQIGLINYADTSDGFSIGLINIVKKGYHKWFIGTDETMQLTSSIKSGNRKLYSILLGGMNLDNNQKMYAFGYGLGTEWIHSRYFAMSTDLTSQYLYLGSWDYLNLLNRFSLNLHFRISRNFAIYGGPSFNAYYSDQTVSKPGWATNIPANGYKPVTWDNYWRGWGGWQAGIAIF